MSPKSLLGFAGFLLLSAAFPATAQEDCKSIANDANRLACYDQAYGSSNLVATKGESDATGTAEKAAASKDTSPPEWLSSFQLRDQGMVSKAGSDPANFSASRNKGQDVVLAKFAVIWAAPFSFTSWGWQPFASVGVNRNTLSSSTTDVHSANVGISGSLFDYTKGFAVWSTLSGTTREDLRKNTKDGAAILDNYLAIRALVNPSIEDSYELDVFPRFGFSYDDQHEVPSGSHPGTYHGYFWGARGTYIPGAMQRRLQLTALFQRYRDTSASAPLLRRDNSYSKIGLDYYFYDQTSPSANSWLQPAIGISREVGSDPLTGSLRNDLTMVSLKLKVN